MPLMATTIGANSEPTDADGAGREYRFGMARD
jgi:hypothetical protein